MLSQRSYWPLGKGSDVIVIIMTLIGAFWGAYLAKKRKGNRLDIAQHAASSAILFCLIGLFATILIARILG